MLRLLQALVAGLLVVALLPGAAAAARCESLPSGLEAVHKMQNTGRDEVGQDLDRIRERGTILIAVYEDFPPYSWQDSGKLRGVDVDLGREIAAYIGVKPEFLVIPAGETVDADLRVNIWKGGLLGNRVANVMMHVPYNTDFACRNDMAVFTGQYFDESLAIAFRRDKYPDSKPVPAYFRYDLVGVENDSIADFYLSDTANGQLLPNIRRYASTGAAMAALRAGEVSAVLGPRAQLEFGLDDSLDIHQPPLPGLALGNWTVGLAVRFTFRALGYEVDDAVGATIASGRMAGIFDSYGLSYTAPPR